MPRIFKGPAGGRKGRAAGKWDEKRQAPPNPLQTVTASYVRDGLSQKDAEHAAQEWQERMNKQRAEIAAKQSQ